MKPSCVALIPARSGSKRLPDKNVKPMAGHPLIAYTIRAAIESGVFAAVVVSTDSRVYADIARYYGAEVPFLRPAEMSGEHSPDIEWIEHALKELKQSGREYDCFSILRPTSPFRQPSTIRRAWEAFLGDDSIDSLRAVEKCGQHPGKMWIVQEQTMIPLLSEECKSARFSGVELPQPWHSCQYQSLPDVYVQNASLEIAWVKVIHVSANISGETLMPFFTEGYEGFDTNTEYDWRLAEELVREGRVDLPPVIQTPWEGVPDA